jgi:hypothetical protein
MSVKYTWTFYFNGAAKVLSEIEDEPFVSVLAKNYAAAVKKILKLGIPHVNAEDDLKFYSMCEEENDMMDEGSEVGV